MALKKTVATLRKLVQDIATNLDKADRGNKTAAQRVRTFTIRLAKISKLYRKESIAAEKKKKR